MHKIKKIIKKHALVNAVSHDGEARVGSVIGKVIGEKPEVKSNLSNIKPIIQKTVNKINKLSQPKQEKKLRKIYPAFFKQRRKREKELAELPGAQKGKVVTRMPPEPGKYMTAGHALSFLINYLYAEKYNGKCVLRFEDTNPEKANKESVKSFKDGIIRYLKIKPSKIVFVSDRIPRMYGEIEKLIKSGKAYACSCPSKKISKFRRKKRACEHRKQSNKKNMEIWKKMLTGSFKKNDWAIRLVGKMGSKNAVLRDPVIARLNYHKHYRHGKKYAVWPTFDLANTCEDEWCGVTHILRDINFGNERIELQKHIARLLDYREKYYIQYGRFNISGLKQSSGRTLRRLVSKGVGWDDPRMPTLAALERRGFVKETFYKLAKQVGLSKTDTKIDKKTIAAINRSFIDPIANRYFFVGKPIKIRVKNAPKIKTAELKIHPGKKGTRKIKVSKTLFIEKNDFIENIDKEIRLKGLYNIQILEARGIRSKKVVCSSAGPKHNLRVIQWVPKEHTNVDVLLTNGKTLHGIAEKNVEKLKIGSMVQFERFGFCRLDKKLKKKLVFVWGHQ